MNLEMRLLLSTIFLLAYLSGVYSQAPLNWTRDEINPNEDFTLSPDITFFSEGFMSLRMELNSNAVPYLYSDVYYISPGAGYEFSVDVFDDDTAGQVKIYADFYDTYGFNIYDHSPVYSSDSEAWQTYGWEGVIPGEAVVGYILIKFYCQPDLYHFIKNAQIWIDNVQFKMEGGENLVTNGGFEHWNVGFSEYNIENKSFPIYPDPAKNFIIIEPPERTYEVRICNFTGKEMIHQKVSSQGKIMINIETLANGLYFVTCIPEKGPVQSSKFIVSK